MSRTRPAPNDQGAGFFLARYVGLSAPVVGMRIALEHIVVETPGYCDDHHDTLHSGRQSSFGAICHFLRPL